MSQKFLTFAISHSSRVQTVIGELRSRGFDVGDANRLVKPAIQIRIREGTGDQAEVERIIATYDPSAKPMPGATPSMNLVGYREGH